MQTKVIDFAFAEDTPPEIAEKAMAVSDLMQFKHARKST